jgi:hypothetical protein
MASVLVFAFVFQVNDVDPVAVSVADSPVQSAGLLDDMPMVGVGVTLMAMVLLSMQPPVVDTV